MTIDDWRDANHMIDVAAQSIEKVSNGTVDPRVGACAIIAGYMVAKAVLVVARVLVATAGIDQR